MKECLETFVHYFLFTASRIMCNISVENSKRAAYFIGYLAWLSSARSKRVARKNLSIIFKKYDKKLFDNYIKQMFLNYGNNVVDFLRCEKFNERSMKERVQFSRSDREYVTDTVKNGGIMLTGHFGNWEILGMVYGRYYNMYSFYLRPKLKKLGEFIVKQREHTGSRMIEREDIKKAVKILKNKGVIGVLADHDGGPTGIITDFFNKKVSVPTGVSAIAYRTKVPIICSFVYHCGKGDYKIKIIDTIWPDDANDKKTEIRRLTERIIKVYEKVIFEDPQEWLLVYDRWKPRRHCN